MFALVKYGQKPDMLEIRDVPIPKVRPGTVLVEVKAAGICGWDIEMWHHSMANDVAVPVVQGHEFSGIIAEVGDYVTGWNIGDAVVSETSAVVCGTCFWCRSGDYQICPSRKGFGYGVDGAFTKYVIVRQEILHKKASYLSFEEAALTEPFCVGHHAMTDRVRVDAGDTVLAIGPGPIGLICLQMARLVGASRTILIGTTNDRVRLELAKKHNWADETVNISERDAIEAVHRITDGKGADVVADCAGNSAAFNTALECVCRGGQIVKIGWGPKPFEYSLDALLRKSIIVAGTFGHNWHNWETVMKLFAAGLLTPKPLISGVLPLTRWREAFRLAEHCQAVKMVLTPV